VTDRKPLTADIRRRAGHQEILGETYAKFEFFEHGWNPYSRFLDVDKVDLILRRSTARGQKIYREVQVKFGKLYPVKSAWERELFDFSSWRFFKENEFAAQVDQKDFFVAYVLSRDPAPDKSDKPAYEGDIFIFPVRDFDRIIRSGIKSKGRKVYLSKQKGEQKWFLRKKAGRSADIADATRLEDVTRYRRNFEALEPSAD